MSDQERIDELLEGLGRIPPLYDRETIEAQQTHQLLTQPTPVDKYREELGLTPSAAYQRATGPIPEKPKPGTAAYNLANILAAEEDPVAAIAYINAAEYIAKTFDIDPQEAYRDLPGLSQYWFGEIRPPDVFLKSVKQAWDNGMINIERAKLALALRERGGSDPLLEQQIAELTRQMTPLQEIPRPWLKNAILMATESTPLMANAFFKGGIAGGTTGAVAGLLLGAAAIPLTAGLSIPTITMLMASVGFTSTGTTELIQNMRGLQYLDLRDQGVPHDIAAPISDVAGIIQGAIESVGQMLIGVRLPGVTPILKSAGSMVANKLMMTGTLGTIATRIAANAAATGLSEGIEEPLQEITSIFSEQLSMELAKERGFETDIAPVTLGEFVSRTTEAFAGGFSAGVIFGVAGAPAGIRADTARLARIRQLAEAAPNRAAFVNQVVREDLFISGLGTDARGWRDYLGKVWAKAHPGAETTPPRPTTAAETQQRPVPPEGEEAAPRPEGEYRTKEGRLYVIEQELTATKEGRNAILKVGDPTNRIRYGYILYEHTAGDIYIQEVVNEVEQDLRREMLLELAVRHPEAEIEWNPIEEDEIAIKEGIIADNPQGPEAGLQWYSSAEAEPEVELTKSVFVQRISEAFNLGTEEATAFSGVVEAFARARGMSANAYLQSFIGPQVIIGGPSVEEELAAGRGTAGTRFETVEGEAISPLEVDAEEFKTRVRAFFVAMQGQDLHIALHEFFHAVERLALSENQRRLMERALGKPRDAWTEADLEFLADMFEEYLATGQAPTEAHRSLFEQLKAILMQLISFMQEHAARSGNPVYRLSPELSAAFDALFVTPEAQPEFALEGEAPLSPQERGEQIQREYEEYITSREDLADEVSEEIVETMIDPTAAEPEPPPTITVVAESAAGITGLPIKDLQLSEEVLNFKEEADEAGIVEPLGGETYERIGTAPIVVWERTSGRLEVITGRHRLDLARRLGEETIPAQIVRESEGFTAEMAMTFDAESNIRDGQGSIRDYANYFRFSEITEEEASSRGLLERNKGRTGFAIGRYATDGLYTAFRNNQINETKTAAIASAAPANESVQNEGIRQAKELNADELVNYLHIIQDLHPTKEAEQTELFGKSDPFMLEAARLAREAAKKQAELQNEYRALKGALRLSRGEQQRILSKYGFQAGDMVAVQERVDELTFEIEAWKDWTTDSEKHAELRERLEKDTLLHPVFLYHDAGDQARIIQAAVDWFGTTNDPDEAGYILPDGRMLDLSGRHYASGYTNKRPLPGQPDYLKGSRNVDHRELFSEDGNPLGLEESGTAGMIEFMCRSGAMRFAARALAESVGIPTAKQISVVADAFMYEDYVTLEIMDEDGNALAHAEIDDPTRTKISRFFNQSKRDFLLHEKTPEVWSLKSEQIILEKMRGPMQASAIKKMLQNNGVKADEMKWIGLDEFLEKDRKITPEQMLEHIKNNNIQLTEVVLGTHITSITDPELERIRTEALAIEHTRTRMFREASEMVGNLAPGDPWINILKYAQLQAELPEAYLEAFPDYDWQQLRDINARYIQALEAQEVYGKSEEYAEVFRERRETSARYEELYESARIELRDSGLSISQADQILFNLTFYPRDLEDLEPVLIQAKTALPDFPWQDLLGAHARMKFAEERFAVIYSRESSTEVEAVYENYTLPGGQNYSEILFTIPTRPYEIPHFNVIRRGDTWQAIDAETGEVLSIISTKELRTFLQGRGLTHEPNEVDARVFLMDQIFAEQRTKGRQAVYRSPHWEAENVVAHTRVDERLGSGNENVLFLEEIQSDWHQEGRKGGYQGEEPRAWDVLDSSGHVVEKFDTYEEAKAYADAERERLGGELLDVEEGIPWGARAEPVPDAPWRKTWHELVFRRMLHLAVEQGYDRIAWTTGRQQADRYNLANYADEIRYFRDSDGEFRIRGIGGGRELLNTFVADNQLEDFVGHEVAENIRNGIGPMEEDAEGVEEHILYANDLQVGGRGMSKFYDDILVKYANKFAKKWGVRVEDYNVETDSTPMEGTPLRVIPAVWPSTDHFTIQMESPEGPEVQIATYGAYETREQAEAALRELRETGLQTPATVHSLAINNTMRKELGTSKSLYLFHQAEDQKRIINAAKQYLGVTDDPTKTGYIFPDGSMVDMSEGTWARCTDHGDALKIRKLGLKAKADDYFGKIFEFQKRSGAIRYDGRFGYASAAIRPTNSQLRKMLQGWEDNNLEIVYLSITASDGRDQRAQNLFNPTLGELRTFFNQAPQMLKHLSGEWAGKFIYGTEIDEQIWNQYVERAKGYLSAEDFQHDIEQQYGELYVGDVTEEEAAKFYRAVWDEAQEPAPEQEDLFGGEEIPSPEIRDADRYDYDEKREAAQDIEDEELASKMERGEANEADLETPPEDLETTRDEAEKSQAESRQAYDDLSDEGKRMVEIGDEIDETIERQETTEPAEEDVERQKEIRRHEEKLADLYKQFEDALLSDLSTAEALVGDMIWTRAIIMPSQLEATEDAAAAAGAQLEKAVQLGRKLQKAFDNERFKREKAKIAERHKASRARIYAKKREQFKRYKEQLRAKQKEQRAKKKYREAKKKIIADIMRPPGRSVAYKGYAEEIRNIQRGLDPKKRQKKTLWRREQTRKFLEQNPEAAAYMDPEYLDKVYSVSLPDMTLEQLEKIKETIDALRKLGRLKRSLELTQERRLRQRAIALAQSTVLRGEAPRKPVGGVPPTPRFFKTILPTLKPDRVAKWLDGAFEGGPDGVYTEWLQDRPNEAWSNMQRMIRTRTKPVLKKMAELKLTADPLDTRRVTQGFTFIGERLDIEGFKYDNGKRPTIQDAMFWYIGMRNERTAPALVHGCNIPEEILLKGIGMLTPEQRAFADAISVDFEENFPRLRDAFIDIFNIDLPGEDFYVPMRRLMVSYETREEEIAMELTGRAGVRKQFIARNPTYARLEIADEHQKPIRTDLMSLWIEGVKIQEGFIHQDLLVKRLHSIFESDEVRLAVQQKYGPDFNKWIRQYINDLAQADAYAAMSGIEKFSRAVRTNAAVGWLAFNLSPHLKQLTGPLNYLGDTGPFWLASAAAQFAAGKGKSMAKGKFLNNTVVDFVDSKTELLQGRVISQEFADLQRVDKNLYMQFVKKIGHVGMHALQLIDKATVYIGWKAVYDKEMNKHGIEARAIQAADKATTRTQPSHRIQDMAQIYREGELLKWFTMFTSELSAIWNRMIFDVPLALKRHELMHALGDMVAFSMVGIGIAIAAGALQGDEPEEKKRKMIIGAFSQYIDAIPFFGNDIMNIVSNRQFQTGGVKIFPAIDYVRYVPKQFARGDIEAAVGNLAEGAAFATGLPTSGPIKAVRTIKSKDMRDLLGWPRSGR